MRPVIFGIRYSFWIKLVFNFLKSDTIRTVSFGLGMINVGLAQALQEAFSVCSGLPYDVSPCTEFSYEYELQEKVYYALDKFIP